MSPLKDTSKFEVSILFPHWQMLNKFSPYAATTCSEHIKCRNGAPSIAVCLFLVLFLLRNTPEIWNI